MSEGYVLPNVGVSSFSDHLSGGSDRETWCFKMRDELSCSHLVRNLLQDTPAESAVWVQTDSVGFLAFDSLCCLLLYDMIKDTCIHSTLYPQFDIFTFYLIGCDDFRGRMFVF